MAAPELHKLWDISASRGGRIIPNKLWFFAAVRETGFDREIFDAFYTDGSPMLNNRRLPYWSGKLSYQMNQAHKFGGFYHDAKELEHRGGSRFVPAESREVYEGPLATWGGSWQIVHGNSLVRSLQSGAFYQKAWYFAEPAYENIRAGNDDDPKVHKIPTLDTFTSMRTGDAPSDGQWLHRYRYPTKGTHQLLQAELPRRQPSVQGRVRLHQLRISPAAAREAAGQLPAAVQQRRRRRR